MPHGRARGESPRVSAVAIDRAAFIRANTKLVAPPLVPEIRLHLAEQSVPIWEKTEAELQETGLPPPYWAFAWAGGQALARYLLDTPGIVRGRRVVDLAAGSGLCAIAALKAAATAALAADIDIFAEPAIRLNAAANGVRVATTTADLLDGPVPDADTVLVGDLFYEKALAQRALGFLAACRAGGLDVLIGDPDRSYCPRDRLVPIARYAVPVTRELEDALVKETMVWRLAGDASAT